MIDDLFLITGGGTGAKVAESFVHLCGSGMGPARAHVLFVDADTTNGNLQRALSTARAYRDLQAWPWAVETTLGGFLGRGGHRAGLDLFRTELSVSEITQPIKTTHENGIVNTAPPSLHPVFDLLYDDEEQNAKCDDGFRARPNLGCILLAEHLRDHLRKEGRPFLDALKRAANQAGGKHVPVVVTASVFGGTGASLIPIVRGVVEGALREMEAQSALDALRWSAVMLLPHYQPKRRVESVDPDRYLLDTASALQFYGTALQAEGAAYHAVYVVGSDRPSRNLVEPKLGKEAQANPAYVEEVVAALAALDFGRQPNVPGRPVRAFKPESGAVSLDWEGLPLGSDRELQRRMAYLLQLAAFYLRPGNRQLELSQGLAALLRRSTDEQLYAYSWYRDVLDPWAEALNPVYASTPKDRRPTTLKDPAVMGTHSAEDARSEAVEYFGRLLLWAATALRSSEGGADTEELRLIDYIQDDYTRLYGAMSKFKGKDLDRIGEQNIEPKDDNALVRLLRTALVALVSEHEKNRKKGMGITVGGDVPLLEADGRIGIRIAPADVHTTFAEEGLGNIADEYTRTSVLPEAA